MGIDRKNLSGEPIQSIHNGVTITQFSSKEKWEGPRASRKPNSRLNVVELNNRFNLEARY